MAAKSIVRRSWIKARAPSTENLSLGRRFEAIAALICRDRGVKILERNRWWKFGEIDLLIRCRNGSYAILEVRGRRGGNFRPVEMITAAKKRRLKRLALAESLRLKQPVRVDFLEIIGDPGARAVWVWRWLRIPCAVRYAWLELD